MDENKIVMPGLDPGIQGEGAGRVPLVHESLRRMTARSTPSGLPGQAHCCPVKHMRSPVALDLAVSDRVAAATSGGYFVG